MQKRLHAMDLIAGIELLCIGNYHHNEWRRGLQDSPSLKRVKIVLWPRVDEPGYTYMVGEAIPATREDSKTRANNIICKVSND
jgi:hypothetical protein